MTRFIFSLGIFVGSFLLFLIQPMVGKILLPGFGGAAAVWTTCMLFFQAALLAGYLYAEKSIRLLRRELMKWWKLYMGYQSFTNPQIPAAIFANNLFDRIDIL